MQRSNNTRSVLISTGILVASFVLFFRRQREKKKKKGSQYNGSDKLGSRGERSIFFSHPYYRTFLKCLEDPCDPESNRDGYIALCVAENKLAQEFLAQRLMKPGTAITAFSDSCVYEYNGFLGLPPAREAAAYFLARRFLLAKDGGHSSICARDPDMTEEQISDRIDPENVALGSGCTSLLSHLIFTLAEEGDAVLIPSPYYSAFEKDMKLLAGCVPFAVHSVNPVSGPTVEDFENAASAAKSAGLTPSILLLTNPHNPLGTIYHQHFILNAITWARSKGIQTIVDEVYALSTFRKINNGFESVLKILNNKLGDDVHHIWAFSKDFGASGFRIATLYTQNRRLLRALSNMNIISCVSHPMQMIMAEILMDDDFVDTFLDYMRTQIRKSYEICARKLDEMVIPFVPAEAGFFVYVDFSSVLPEPTFKGEAMFANLVEREARVVMVPGKLQSDHKPGFFRICYALVSPEVLEIAMERLSLMILQLRRGSLSADHDGQHDN